MKLNGRKLTEPCTLTLVLPREGGEDIVFRTRAILNYDDFHKLCPIPKPPMKIIKGGARQPDLEHPEYLAEVNDYSVKKMTWMILKSLKATEGLEWETVDYADPSTWSNYEKELEESGFSEIERQRILALVIDTNCLNDKKLDEAHERFLSVTQVKLQSNGSTSQKDVPENTPSGEPANELAVTRQT